MKRSLIRLLIMHDEHVLKDGQCGFGAFAVFAQGIARQKTAVDVDQGTDVLAQFSQFRPPQAYYHTKLLRISPLSPSGRPK